MNEVKIDATQNHSESPVPLKLTNDGVGTATKVTLHSPSDLLRIESPHEPIAVPAGSDRIVHVIFSGQLLNPNTSLNITWSCEIFRAASTLFPIQSESFNRDRNLIGSSSLAAPHIHLIPFGSGRSCSVEKRNSMPFFSVQRQEPRHLCGDRKGSERLHSFKSSRTN